ncbi:phosphotransferase [Streptomyces litchfieldiae]|uniref:Phosphotransferase n=1 Tax=Streptomyces litchfieldiae TaxID=3075543 RepID=A0ABU2MMA3_9ACTN|nr:phosphotransferase [Streptomyces sp. DSM 44938]MDT0342254.1 phosphotransferase [Streptomyces sp. DSM 44938]
MPPTPDPGTGLTHRTLTALLRRYDAGEPVACERVAEGLLNRGYRLATTRGRFFLKHHLGGDPEAVIPLPGRHRATAALAAYGLPVVPPLADREGRTVAVHRSRCYALHPWVEGRHRHGGQLSRGQSRRLGTLLGGVHRALERVIGRAPQPRSPEREAVAPADTYVLIDQLLGRIRARARRTAFDELAEQRLLERRLLVRDHAHQRPDRDQVPAEGWVHGDFHPLNLIYRAEGPVEPVAIVDWDRLGVRPRAEEAVRAAAIFYLRPDGSLELPKVRAYARAYRRAAGASPAELAAAVHRVWWERLNDFWMLRWHYERGDHRADHQFPAAAALVPWWTRNGRAVRDAFCD